MIETYTPDFTKKATAEFAWSESGKKLLKKLKRKIGRKGQHAFYQSILHEARPSLVLTIGDAPLSDATIVSNGYQTMTYKQMAKACRSSIPHVWRLSQKLGLTGRVDPNVKQVINTKTGVTYSSLLEAAKSIGISRSWLSRKLNGIVENDTDFRLLK